MKLNIDSPESLALALRAVRRHSRVRLDDLARTVGVSKQTASNVEQGRAKLSTVLAFLRELGMVISVEVPESALPLLKRMSEDAAGRDASATKDEG